MDRRLNVIGCGRAAGALARLWLQAGAVEPGCVLNRSPESTAHAVARLGAGRPASSGAEMDGAGLWLIGTGDDSIGMVAEQLAHQRDDLQDTLVFHLAGRFGPEVLEPVGRAGAETGALHPVRSLNQDALTLEDFAGTACVAAGGDTALAALRPLVEAIGGVWLPVGAIDRGLYHASVSIISNVTKAVAWKAQNWLETAGLPADTAATVARQLLRSTKEDLVRSGARQTITGPIVRGDTRTIESHLAALHARCPEDTDVYRVLARTVLELAQDRGDLDEATLQRFQSLLDM